MFYINFCFHTPQIVWHFKNLISEPKIHHFIQIERNAKLQTLFVENVFVSNFSHF